jgi:hypothetical protein
VTQDSASSSGLSQVIAEASARYVEHGAGPDSIGSGPFAAIKRVIPSLPSHVVYQPKDLTALHGLKMPLYLFGNGACSDDGASSRHHLLEIASHGYLAIAPGGIFSGPAVKMTLDDFGRHRSRTCWAQLGEALDWAVKQSELPDSPFYGLIDHSRVAMSGYSCGGIQALKYAGDPHVTTFVIMNSGILDPSVPQSGEMAADKSLLDRITVPTLYVLGGPDDIAYSNGMDDFSRLRAPAVAINTSVGHSGTYADPNGGRVSPVVVAWLNWQLRSDRQAARWFVGADCLLSSDPNWTIERRNFGA